MYFSVLASGSKANCTYVEINNCSFLIDCGLTAKQIELRLARIGVSADSLSAIFISHEHRDHIQGASVLSRRYRLPVYANARTAAFIQHVHGLEIFETGRIFSHGPVQCHPFRIIHDAVDPVGFVFEGAGIRLAHVTDLGRVTTLVREAIRGSHALVLEANYDKELLQTCDYPWELKQRIASSFGHLANNEAADLLREFNHSELCQVVLAHLSENSNTPRHALQAVQSVLSKSGFGSVTCGSPHEPTELFSLEERAPLALVQA